MRDGGGHGREQDGRLTRADRQRRPAGIRRNGRREQLEQQRHGDDAPADAEQSADQADRHAAEAEGDEGPGAVGGKVFEHLPASGLR